MTSLSCTIQSPSAAAAAAAAAVVFDAVHKLCQLFVSQLNTSPSYWMWQVVAGCLAVTYWLAARLLHTGLYANLFSHANVNLFRSWQNRELVK